jgi:hypothetical protein
MWSDIVDDEHGFAKARLAFLSKRRVERTAAATV